MLLLAIGGLSTTFCFGETSTLFSVSALFNTT